MPFIQKIKENNCQIAIWEIRESLAELIQLSKGIYRSEFKTKKRNKEFLISRLLMNKLLPSASISYNKYGAPEIGNNHFISISHSKHIAAIIISKKKVGLDVEQITKKPLKLASKFISTNKSSCLTKEMATLIWSCKEAIFKWHQKGNINFTADIKIAPFIIHDSGKVIAEFRSQKHTLHYKKIDAHFLVYVCK